MDFDKLVCQVVEEKQGCKATELAADVRIATSGRDLPSAIQRLVFAGDLVEIEYILPKLNFRIKSFLLPKGTEVSK